MSVFEKQVFRQNLLQHSVGEHITEVMVWADSDWVCAIQFVTNYRRVSPHYGGEGGAPTLLRSDDGILVAISGKWRQHPIWERDMFRQIQVRSTARVMITGYTYFNARQYGDMM